MIEGIHMPNAGRYQLDPGRCSITFRTRHLFGLAAVSGTMRVSSGEITLDPAVPSASVTASVTAASFSTGNRTRDRDVRSARFLDADAYPELAFRAETLSRVQGRWTLTGELTVREVRKLVTLTIHSVEAAGVGFRARANTRIDRYSFGLTAARGMAARFLDVDLTVAADPR